MEIEELVAEIMEAFVSEPDTDYGDEATNQHIRNRGIEAHIRDLVEDYEKDLEIIVESEELEKKDAVIFDLRGEIDILKSRINRLISEAA